MGNFKPNFKCSPLKFLGDPWPGLWCALASLGQCLPCVKISGSSTPRGRDLLFRKSPLGWVNMSIYNFLVSGSKFTKFISSNRGWNIVDKVLFRFSIWRSVPDSGDIRDQSRKLAPIVKLVSTWSPRPRATSPCKVLWGYENYHPKL